MSEGPKYRRLPDVPGTAEDAAREVDSELDFHTDMRIRELEETGLSAAEARREVARRFGDLEKARRRLRGKAAHGARRASLRQLLGEGARDLRHAARRLRRSPGYATVAVLTLALGIGTTTAIFSVVNAVLLRPLPYPEPDRLVSVWEVTPEGDDHNVASPGNFFDWREGSASFEELAAYGYSFSLGMSGDGRPVQIRAAQVTPGLFPLLGVDAALGRVFVEEEGQRGGEWVGLLSHGFWRQRFGADPGVIGRTLTLSDSPMRVVGVLPRDFAFPQPGIEVVLPLRFDEEERQERRSHRLLVLGRLAPGVTRERAQDDLTRLASGIAERHPEYMQGWGVHVTGYREDLVRAVRPSLLVLLAAVALVLLVACVNVANLLLARALSCRREVAVRAALGAGRGRLLRMVLGESALLAGLGASLGLLAVAASLRLLVGLGPADVPLLQETRLDGGVLAFAAGAAVLSTLLFGVLPALRTAGTDLQAALRDGQGATGGGALRARSALLVLEVALSVLLMTGAGLLVRSLVRLQEQSLGFDTDRLLAVSLDLPYARYEGRPQQRAFYRALMERVAALPGVVSVAGTTEPPVVGFNNTFSFEIEGRPRPGPNPRQEPASLRPVTEDYFRRIGIPLLAGRAFTDRDGPEAPPVAIVNRTMAERLWPDGGAVGSRVRRAEDQPWIEVVGIVGDTRHFGLEEPVEPAWYIPYDQAPWGWMSWMTLLLRTRGDDPLALAPELEQAVWSLDPDLPVHRIAPVEDLYAEGLARRRIVTTLMGGFAAVALALGAIGLYGVLSYAVAQRTREFGVRMALGATAGGVRASVLRQGLALALLGFALGGAAALALGRLLSGLLYGVAGSDPLTFLTVAVVLLATAALACWLPARRATRVDPVTALRGG